MWTLSKSFTFEASHQLPFHDGKCARLHGHSWKMIVTFQGDKLEESGPKEGMLVDYYDIGKICKKLVEDNLDHYHLNDLLANPTSEKLSEWCFKQIKKALPEDATYLLHSVEICETCTTGCVYHGK